jgi:hypothetical protein
MFPEGKVNQSGKLLRLKWGVGKLITDAKSAKVPWVIPFHFIGMPTNKPVFLPFVN